MKRAEAPEQLHSLFVEALNAGDVDALAPLYAPDGFLMAQRDTPAQGRDQIREALARYVAMEPAIQLTTRKVVQAGDIALLVGDWLFHGTAGDGQQVSTSGTSVEVARRQSDGRWCYLIDLPYGLHTSDR